MVLPVWLVAALWSIGLSAVSYVLTPKPKGPKAGDATREFEAPTASASKVIGKVFGEVWIKDPNCLWYGDKEAVEHEIKV